jgi:hypothetical protein
MSELGYARFVIHTLFHSGQPLSMGIGCDQREERWYTLATIEYWLTSRSLQSSLDFFDGLDARLNAWFSEGLFVYH